MCVSTLVSLSGFFSKLGQDYKALKSEKSAIFTYITRTYPDDIRYIHNFIYSFFYFQDIVLATPQKVLHEGVYNISRYIREAHIIFALQGAERAKSFNNLFFREEM